MEVDAQLLRDDLILPLTVHPLWTHEVADPPADLVDFWKDKIRDCRKKVPGHAGRDRDLRDARALVQTLILNRDALEATKDAEFRQRFVLVTADNAVQEAFMTAFWTGEAQAEFEKAGLHGICRPDQLDDFTLRRPLQYLQLMNVKDIPNGFKLGTLFKKLVAVLDDHIGMEERRSDLPKPVVELIDIARRSRGHARQDPVAAATRLPRTQIFRFNDLTRTETLDDFIDRLADPRVDSSKQISLLRAELQKVKSYRVRLLAGSVALLTNHFETAPGRGGMGSSWLRPRPSRRPRAGSTGILPPFASTSGGPSPSVTGSRAHRPHCQDCVQAPDAPGPGASSRSRRSTMSTSGRRRRVRRLRKCAKRGENASSGSLGAPGLCSTW